MTTTTRSVERALNLLSVICDSPEVSLSDLARTVDLAPSSALRLLRTLMGTGHIARTPDGRYTVGPQMIWLSGRVLAGNSLRRICRPAMTELAAETGETIYLSVRHGSSALYIGMTTGSQAVQHRSWEGQTIPLGTSAAGAALTGRIGSDPYAVVSSGVERDVTAIAAPIIVGEETVAALSMVVPNYRLGADAAHIGQLIAARAAKLAELLGSEPPPHHQRRSLETARRMSGHGPLAGVNDRIDAEPPVPNPLASRRQHQ